MRKIDPQNSRRSFGDQFAVLSIGQNVPLSGQAATLKTKKTKRGKNTMNHNYKYHIMKRSKDENIIATGAYQHRQIMKDEMELDSDKKIKESNTNKEDVLEEAALIPENNPQEIKSATIEFLLNKLNKKKGNRVASQGQLSLQKELTYDQNMEAVNLFAKKLALDDNCIFIYAVHDQKNNNQNYHLHYMVSLYPLVGGEFVPKTQKIYLDEKNQIIEKTDQPILKKGQLQYNQDGSLKTKKGWKKLDLDQNGNIQYDEKGKVKLKDIRIETTKSKNGKYLKQEYKHWKKKMTNLERRGTTQRTRYLWQDCLNDVCKKYKIKDKHTGKILKYDFRSNEEKDKHLPLHEQRIRRRKIGPYKNKTNILYNNWCDRIQTNKPIPEINDCPFEILRELYYDRQESIKLTTELKRLQKEKSLSGKANKVLNQISKSTSKFIKNIKNLFNKHEQHKQIIQDKKMSAFEQIIETDRKSNIDFYLRFPGALQEKAKKKSHEAKSILNYSEIMKDYTKNNYYLISDTSKTYKEYLQIKLMQKLKKPFSDIENLGSKQFATICKANGLTKEFNDYDIWLKATQDYYKKLPKSEQAKSRPAYLSKTFTTLNSSSSSIIETSKIISPPPVFSKDSNGTLSVKDPNIEVKWKDKDNHKLNDMEKAEKNLYENWEHFVPDSHPKNTSKNNEL